MFLLWEWEDIMAGLPGVSGSAGPELVADALGEVYAAHYDRLMGFFVRRTRNRPLSEDLTHDVLLRFAESGLHDGVRPVWPYMKAIAGNVLVDHLRRDSREVLDGAQEWEAGLGDDVELEDDLLLRDLVGSVIGRLPERQQVVVELRYGRAWTVGEAADLLGISAGTCRQLLLRARRNLKAALEESGSRIHGVVAPVLVGFRVRWRTASARLRDLAQAPGISVGVDGMASVMIATGLAIAAVTSSSVPASPHSALKLELASASVVPGGDLSPAAKTTLPSAGSSDKSTVPSSGATGTDDGDGNAERWKTEVVTSDSAVVRAEGKMAVQEDEESFSITDEVVVWVGDEGFSMGGGVVYVGCASMIGDVVCSVDEDPTPW